MNQKEISQEAFGLSKIFSTIQNMFKSEDLLAALTYTRSCLNDATLVAVETAIEDTKTVSFVNNPEYKSALATIRRHYGSETNKLELFPAFKFILVESSALLDELIALVDKYFTPTVDKDAISYPRAQIMALGESVDFITTFIPRYIRFIVARQTEISGGPSVTTSLTKAQLKYISANTLEFYKTLSTLNKTSAKEIEKQLKAIPDVTVSEDGKEKSMFNQYKLDPTGSVNRFLSASTNPFYYVGMAWVDYQHSKYKLAKEESETIKIELEVMNSMINNGTADAYLEKQKEKAQERLNKLEYQIEKYEQKARSTVY